MIRCLVCGRWVSRLHNADKELNHLDHHIEENSLIDPDLTQWFEVVRR